MINYKLKTAMYLSLSVQKLITHQLNNLCDGLNWMPFPTALDMWSVYIKVYLRISLLNLMYTLFYIAQTFKLNIFVYS